jgi:REP element-mobilizing transposase RayT
MRVVDGLPSLRKKRVFRVIKQAFGLANTEGKHRDHFRLTHFSVQGNHMHLVAEASDETRLARGMQGLTVRIARRVNRELGRTGRVFARRYYARALKTARDVRTVLAYVLLNEQHHLYQAVKLCLSPWYYDPCSSAFEFDGWLTIHGLDPPPPPHREATVPARSALLRVLWRQHGLIAAYEVPGLRAAS